MIDVALASDTITAIAGIGIPIFLLFCAAMVGIVKAALRIGKYMTLSEESQESTARSNGEIRDKLNSYISQTDGHLGVHDREIAILQAVALPANRKHDA
jgi:hypothetical protein